ncbi:SDR family NAD(P)-dependent oxidoreductase [Helcobacillus massiliensis]
MSIAVYSGAMTRALITGATSGLGLEFAWQLAGLEHDLVLVARNAERLDAVAAQIESLHDVRVSTLAVDLSDRDGLDRAARRLTDPVTPIDLLVNNAGYGLHTEFLATDVEEHEIQLDLLVRAVLVLSHTAANSMMQRGRGAIINVSSLAGYTAAGTYAAAKSWVTVFTEALALELEGTGVTATALLPGFVETEFHERAAIDVQGLPRVTWLKAPYVVEQALKDSAKGEVLSIPSLKYRTASEISRIMPRPLIRRLTGPGWSRRLNERKLRTARTGSALRRLRMPWWDAPEADGGRGDKPRR